MMRPAIRQARALGLSEIETALFLGLGDEAASPSTLARRLKRPRTSLLRPLEALRKRGLAERVRVGKRVWWKGISTTALSQLLSGGDTAQQHPDFFLHQGKEALLHIYHALGSDRGTRALFVQPNNSLVSSLSVYTEGELIEVNTRIKKNDVIMETILQEDVIPVWARAIRKHGWSIDRMFQSVSGRAADTTYVPTEFLNSNSELIVLPRVAYIVNWHRLVAIEIRNQDTIGFLKDLFALAKYFGTKADLTHIVERARQEVEPT